MGLDKITTVDAVGLETESGNVILTIADSWDWIDENKHLFALQAKLNSYFDFIEGNQVIEVYPDSVGKKLVIDVICRYPISEKGIDLLNRASEIASEIGIELRNRYIPDK